MALRKIAALTAAALILSACVHHPIDCAMGFYHADCLPGTAGYAPPAPPCEDDYCRQSRLMLLNAALGNWQNQMRPPQTVYFRNCTFTIC